MKWAILQWHPRGAYWLKGKAKSSDKRAKVLTYPSREAAQESANNIARYPGQIGELEVLEYTS